MLSIVAEQEAQYDTISRFQYLYRERRPKQVEALTLGGDPIVTAFEVDDNILESCVLKVKVFREYTEEWADFVFSNREGAKVETYDIVYGPIANDRIGLQIRKLKDGNIDKAEFLHRLKYMQGITFQYYFGTECAIKYLKRL